jgi:sterol-4alpha-carboxylate 3-dehydrogenase (decarboxylating)
MTQMKTDMMNILLTGGSGFLGKAIVRELLDFQAPVKAIKIRVFDLTGLDTGISDPRIEFIQGDVRDKQALEKACEGIDLVIHSAAIVDWGTRTEEEVYAVNTGGTQNMVDACKKSGVRYLVFTSSLDAVYSGKPLVNIDENQPYPAKHRTAYCRSKALAEQIVLGATGDSLRTVILRPSDIFGEADPYHIGSLVNMAKGGFYVRLGNGKAKCQHIYVGNMAYAHLQAARTLMEDQDRVNGQVYFMTDAAGTNFFKFFDQVVEGAGYRIWPKNFWIPRPVAYAMGSLSEMSAWLIRPFKKYHPKFSRFAVVYTCTEYTFTSAKAIRDFGFNPKYSHNEALQRTIDYYKLNKI